MKKDKKFAIIIAAFVVAAALIVVGGVGTARAVAQYQSNAYEAQIAMKEVGVTISENGTLVADKQDNKVSDLLTNLVPEGETFATNKPYAEVLKATNAGTITEYIRVVLDLYWKDAEGNKLTNLSPSLIGMSLTEDGDWLKDLEANGWVIDYDNSSYLNGGEQLILYYAQPVEVGDSTSEISNFISVDSKISTAVTQTEEDGVVTTVYKYDGVQFGVGIEADAIQTHNAEDAMLSAWGVKVNIDDDGTLSLK